MRISILTSRGVEKAKIEQTHAKKQFFYRGRSIVFRTIPIPSASAMLATIVPMIATVAELLMNIESPAATM